MTRRTESRPLLLVFVGLFSLVVHIPLLLGAVHLFPPSTEALSEPYTIDPIQLVEEDPLETEEEPPQVVSLDKPDQETPPPDKATALDRYNQKADGPEMVRKRDGRRPGSPQTQTAPPRPKPRPAKARQAKREDPVGEKKRQQEGESDDDRSQLPPNADDLSEAGRATADARSSAAKLEGADNRQEADDVPFDAEAPPGSAKDGAQDPDAPADERDAEDIDFSEMMPTMRNALPGEGGSGVKDFLEVPEGEKDILNRKETRYWAFFDRLKEAVRRQWRPNQVYRRHDPRGQVYGVKDRLTIVQVTLNGNGALKEMYVSKPSGLAFLDDEAVRAFRSAQPFPNPPEGLKDENGNIKFAFGFMFEINSSVSRIIRYRR